eukprot:CAMPEP_0203661282 /NCGR_PEP_ID=MMETSP0088-20131115/59527_1 /ASSEMBLY_ACC=CAM_ASM_001087 /TAXON_ID=426623 /ORGANISM="Chaetoceros affinis, Strain CCMP159" /LENGTH=238 /DNA_ID=CAMNT_0050523945 /DNA_START=124 /DNA_END=840 /DNA_ORIENTATION=+
MPKANTELFALTYGSLVTELIKDYDNDIDEINKQLDRIGYSIGVRCIDELLSKCEVNGVDIGPCNSFQNTAEVVAKIGFRCFLGMTCDVTNVTENSFSLFLYENPLSIFVELPESGGGGLNDDDGGVDDFGAAAGGSGGIKRLEWSKLKYSNIYCGVIRGALEQVNMKVSCGIKRLEWSKLKYSNIYCGVIRGALEQVNMKVSCNFARDVLRGDDVNEIKVELKEMLAEGAGEEYQDE